MQQDVQAHQRRAERIEMLLQEVDAFPDSQARVTTGELVQELLDMYGEGLARLLELVAREQKSGQVLIDVFAQDELLASLFVLHGLHPLGIEARITRALDDIRPTLKSHGSGVELVSIEDGVVRLRLTGNCHGCSSSMLKQMVEEAITNAAPDLDRVEVDDAIPAVKPIAFIPRRRSKESVRPTGQAAPTT